MLLFAVSFAVQALALALGPLVLVQPIAALDLLCALPVLARRRHLRLRATDRPASVLVAGSVAGAFDLTDARTKAVVGSFGAGGGHALARKEPYALLAAALTGIVLKPPAHRSGSLLVRLRSSTRSSPRVPSSSG